MWKIEVNSGGGCLWNWILVNRDGLKPIDIIDSAGRSFVHRGQEWLHLSARPDTLERSNRAGIKVRKNADSQNHRKQGSAKL